MDINRAQLETIAKRYGIEVSYVEKGKGGFIVDESNIIHTSVVEDIIKEFNVLLRNNLIIENSSFDVSEISLFAA